jgi:hypothetical protein
MAFDLFSLDVLDEDVERFKKYDEGCLIEGSKLENRFVIIPREDLAARYIGLTCFLPEECYLLLSVSNIEAQRLATMKRKFGGFIKKQ